MIRSFVLSLIAALAAVMVTGCAQTPAAPAPARVSYQLVEASAAFKAEGQINALATQGWRAKSIASSAGAE